MQQFSGIVIFTKKFEEKGILVSCLTSCNKIKTSLLRGIRKNQQTVQIGNVINFEWFGKKDSLGTMNPQLEKSFGLILSIEKQTCGILYCVTFLMNSLFKYEVSHYINLYQLICDYFEYLSNKILKKTSNNTLEKGQYIYYDIEKIIIKNSGWLKVEDNSHFQDMDLKNLFDNLQIRHSEKFFFHRKLALLKDF